MLFVKFIKYQFYQQNLFTLLEYCFSFILSCARNINLGNDGYKFYETLVPRRKSSRDEMERTLDSDEFFFS